MKWNAISLLVLMLALAATAMLLMQQRVANNQLEAQLAEARAIVSAETSREAEMLQVEHENRRLQEMVGELEARLADATASAAAAAAEAKTPDSAKDGSEGKEKSVLGKLFGKIGKDPGMKDFMLQQQELMLDQNFGSLFEHLDLSDEEQAAFRALLVEKQGAAMEMGLQMLDADLSSEERVALGKRIAAEQKRINGEIKVMLGEENYEEFELFEKSQPERQQINMYKQTLTGLGLDLSYEQETELMTAMYEEREGFDYTHDFGKENNQDPDVMSNFTKENLDVFLDENKSLQEKVRGRVEGILSEEQMEVFRKSQESFHSMQEMGMRMGVQIMSGAEKSEE